MFFKNAKVMKDEERRRHCSRLMDTNEIRQLNATCTFGLDTEPKFFFFAREDIIEKWWIFNGMCGLDEIVHQWAFFCFRCLQCHSVGQCLLGNILIKEFWSNGGILFGVYSHWLKKKLCVSICVCIHVSKEQRSTQQQEEHE